MATTRTSSLELLTATGDDVARLTPGGDGWTVTMPLEDVGAQCLALDPTDPDTVYAGARGTGVWKSRDRGMR